MKPAFWNALTASWWLMPGSLGNVPIYLDGNDFALGCNLVRHVEIQLDGFLDVVQSLLASLPLRSTSRQAWNHHRIPALFLRNQPNEIVHASIVNQTAIEAGERRLS